MQENNQSLPVLSPHPTSQLQHRLGMYVILYLECYTVSYLTCVLDQENATKYDSDGEESSIYSSPSYAKTSPGIQEASGLSALSLSVKVDTTIVTAITRVQVNTV